ncbi:MAG TPA: ferrochelatase [Acidimicrobiales bacterium]|nr:ferrochelatase [Acidimicrobiales bacterium]
MIGVLVLAHGTPARREDIAEFYTRIRRGRPPTDDEVAELARRYEAIGGLSPFAARTTAQVAGIATALDPAKYVVRLGQKYAEPYIPDAVDELVAAGVERIVGVVLAPHDSPAVSDYAARAETAVDGRVPLDVIRSWHVEPALIELLAARVREVWIDGALLVVTAHSLPLAALGDDTSYGDDLEQTARRVAEEAGITNFGIAYQSAGVSGGRWLDPSLLDVIREEAGAGTTAVVVCAAGFVSEHLEIAYDLDIEAASLARDLGIGFARTRSLDDDPAFCALVADLVSRR